MLKEQEYDEVDKRFETILQTIFQQIHFRAGNDNVSLALFCLLVRVSNSWRSIRLLQLHTPEQFQTGFMVDAGAVLRIMFDAYLQANFIFREPKDQIERATQYLEFEHVERYKMQQKVIRNDNEFTNTLNSSPYKEEGARRVQKEYDRVKDQFLVEKKQCDGTMKRGPGTRDKWYIGDLFQLAKAAGKEAEYDTFVFSFSGCVHSSAFAIKNGPTVAQDYVLSLASTFTARVATMNVDYNKLDIIAERPILDELCKSWLDQE